MHARTRRNQPPALAPLPPSAPAPPSPQLQRLGVKPGTEVLIDAWRKRQEVEVLQRELQAQVATLSSPAAMSSPSRRRSPPATTPGAEGAPSTPASASAGGPLSPPGGDKGDGTSGASGLSTPHEQLYQQLIQCATLADAQASGLTAELVGRFLAVLCLPPRSPTAKQQEQWAGAARLVSVMGAQQQWAAAAALMQSCIQLAGL